MNINTYNNSLNGGGNNNVIIRIPFKNEHNSILLNSDLNGSIDTTSSKLNVWNFKYDNDTGFDFSILQDNSTYIFINLSKYWRGSWDFVQSYYTMDKSNKSIINPDWDAARHFTLPCFRPIFEFNQE